MLRYLYGLPLFPAATTDEPEQVVNVWTWHELCIVAGKLDIVGLAAYALVELEAYFEKKMEVDEKTDLLKDKANVDWFLKNVHSQMHGQQQTNRCNRHDLEVLLSALH